MGQVTHSGVRTVLGRTERNGQSGSCGSTFMTEKHGEGRKETMEIMTSQVNGEVRRDSRMPYTFVNNVRGKRRR